MTVAECEMNIAFLLQQRDVRSLPNSLAQVIRVADETKTNAFDAGSILVTSVAVNSCLTLSQVSSIFSSSFMYVALCMHTARKGKKFNEMSSTEAYLAVNA